MDVYKRRQLNNKMTSELMQVTAKPNQLTDNNILKGDVFFTPTSETADDIGHCMAIEETLKNTMYSYHLMRYRPYEGAFYLTYPNYAFGTNGVRNKMALMAQGVQRFVLSKSQFENIEISYTKLDEQKKIADFLTNIDSLVTLHQCKRKLTKLHRRFKSVLFCYSWEQRKLNEITDVRDGTHNSPKYVQEGHPFITSKNVNNGFINYDDVQYVTNEDYEEINKRSKVDIHDILMGMIGTIGNLALITEKPDFAIKNVALIKYTGNVDCFYLYQTLQTDCILSQLSIGMDGGTQKFVSLKKIRELEIPIPKKYEQVKIGELFKNLDNLITLHQRE